MKKITLVLTFFILGQSLSMDQHAEQGAIIRRYYASLHDYCTSENVFKKAIRHSDHQHFRNLMEVADVQAIPPLQTMKEWSEQAATIAEHAIAKNSFMDYRRQEDGTLILEESALHPEDPVAVAGCMTCLGSTVLTFLTSGTWLSLIPVCFITSSVQLVQHSLKNRYSDAQELARLRGERENQERIKYDLDRLLEQSSEQENDKAASMDISEIPE